MWNKPDCCTSDFAFELHWSLRYSCGAGCCPPYHSSLCLSYQIHFWKRPMHYYMTFSLPSRMQLSSSELAWSFGTFSSALTWCGWCPWEWDTHTPHWMPCSKMCSSHDHGRAIWHIWCSTYFYHPSYHPSYYLGYFPVFLYCFWLYSNF